MKTIQMTLDEELIRKLDYVVKKLKTTRSAFTRNALREALTKVKEREMEYQHRKGYRKKPVKQDEFGIWEDEQVWVE